jgi:hypothetical protein
MCKTMYRTLIIFITIITMFFQTTTVNADQPWEPYPNWNTEVWTLGVVNDFNFFDRYSLSFRQKIDLTDDPLDLRVRPFFKAPYRIDEASIDPLYGPCRFIQPYDGYTPRVYYIESLYIDNIDHCYANYIGYDMKYLAIDIANELEVFFESFPEHYKFNYTT